MSVTAWTVTARKRHACDNYPRCFRAIKPGEDYARHVAFPGDDANGSHRPWVVRLCQPCHTEHGQEMPPRRARRRNRG